MPVINNTSRNLAAYKKKVFQEVVNLVADKATELEDKATRQAPRGQGVNASFISIDKKFTKKGLQSEVGVFGENDIAAYFEFGTGLSAQQILAPYPQWIRDIAIQFIETGLGTLKGKPYLYNNFLKIQEEFIVELNKILNGHFNDN